MEEGIGSTAQQILPSQLDCSKEKSLGQHLFRFTKEIQNTTMELVDWEAPTLHTLTPNCIWTSTCNWAWKWAQHPKHISTKPQNRIGLLWGNCWCCRKSVGRERNFPISKTLVYNLKCKYSFKLFFPEKGNIIVYWSLMWFYTRKKKKSRHWDWLCNTAFHSYKL